MTKQHLVTVEKSNAKSFEEEVNDLLKKGYEVKSTHVGKREAGSYDEWSVFQAILVKDTVDEASPGKNVNINLQFTEKEE